MTAYDRGQIDVIDARISLHLQRLMATGTIQTRDTTGTGATVIFDASTLAMPVKVPGHVHTLEHDRVTLGLFGRTWVVLGTFSRRQLGEAFARDIGPVSPGTTTSASYVEMPNAVTVPFVKRYDLTAVRLGMIVHCYVTVAPTVVRTALYVEGTPGTETAATFTPLTIHLGTLNFNQASTHLPIVATTRSTLLPSGEYTLTARWLRTSGTGTLTYDSNDWSTIEIDELFRITET